MKKRKMFLVLSMVSALCLFTLAGCGNSDTNNDTTTPTSTSDESQTTNTNDENNADSSLTIGEITTVGEDSMTLSLYESADKVTAATEIDPATLTATGDSDTITIEKDATVERIVNGVTQTTAVDDLSVGDMVAISDDNGQLIVILDTSDTTGTDNDANTSDAATDDTTTDTTTDTNTDSDNTAAVE